MGRVTTGHDQSDDAQQTLTPEQVQLVRKARHSGYQRTLHRMQVGVIAGFGALDSDNVALAMAWLEHLRQVTDRAAKWQSMRWDKLPDVEDNVGRFLAGMEVHQDRAEKFKQWLDMVLGVFTSAGVIPLGMR